jgi:hypothetical protein
MWRRIATHNSIGALPSAGGVNIIVKAIRKGDFPCGSLAANVNTSLAVLIDIAYMTILRNAPGFYLTDENHNGNEK